jgi:hypothetical protein
MGSQPCETFIMKHPEAPLAMCEMVHLNFYECQSAGDLAVGLPKGTALIDCVPDAVVQ